MAQGYTFPALLEQGDDGELIVRFPDLPEALTFGRTKEEALREAADCLTEALRGRLRDEGELPEPSQDVPGAYLIAPRAELGAKAAVSKALSDAMRTAGMSRLALARELKLGETEVRRILNPDHRTKLDRLDEVARALGGRLEVTFTKQPVSVQPAPRRAGKGVAPSSRRRRRIGESG